MPPNDDELENSFSFAGIGRWEYSVDTRALVLDVACRELFELSPSEATSQTAIIERVAEEDRERTFSALDALSDDGDEYDETFRLDLPLGRERWLRGVAKLRKGPDVNKVIGVSFDVTSEQKLLAERELYLSELNHRIKNLFALVGAMISSASRETSDKDQLVENLRDRVAALDRAHSLMLRTDVSQPISFGALLDRILAPTRSKQTIVMSGEEVLIPARAITSLVLIIHEWMTNSTKYGALKMAHGTIEVEWTSIGKDLSITWREWAPEYDAHAAIGFGSHLIKASSMQLRADKERRFKDGWLTIEMLLPLDSH